MKNPSLAEVVSFRAVAPSEILSKTNVIFPVPISLGRAAVQEVVSLFLAYFSGPLPSPERFASSFGFPVFHFSSFSKQAISFPSAFLTVTQFLQVVYSQIACPKEQQFIPSELFTELKSVGIFTEVPKSRRTVLSPSAADFGFLMEHRKDYEVIVTNDLGKQFLLDKLCGMHATRAASLEKSQGYKLR